ncbi:MAG: rane protein [Naasia sp.]|uniref:AI-2E family transporter n=1 Tax=Naasia sp. TaxID=2546198 RepID=UPI0026089C00|nr:AI-2E family transporter [Naasia sp.]MCU1571110.1 rane protein [Naasia sp.]
MKILNPFRVGLLAGLGVLVAIAIGTMIGQLSTILTYVGAALFLALGLDPLVSLLERRGMRRWLSVIIVLAVVLGAMVGILFVIVPVIVTQASALVEQITAYSGSVSYTGFLDDLQRLVGDGIDVKDLNDQILTYLQRNVGTIGGNVLAIGFAITGGVFGVIIVLILTIYFTASLDSLKAGLYQLVPATKRARFADLAEQISTSVGRYVMGQFALALCNGILSLVYLSIIGAQLPVVFAFLAFVFSLVPLVGTLSGSVVIVLAQIVLLPNSPGTWIAAAIYYLIYMQVEAYLLSPIIMRRAVKVPGAIVVIAALTGGTLLGVLGALIAIPVAASILLIFRQVVIPRQNDL